MNNYTKMMTYFNVAEDMIASTLALHDQIKSLDMVHIWKGSEIRSRLRVRCFNQQINDVDDT